MIPDGIANPYYFTLPSRLFLFKLRNRHTLIPWRSLYWSISI